MGLRFYVRSQDGVVTEYDAGSFRMLDLSVTQNAEEGSVATSSLVIHDEDGDLDIIGHRVFGIKEDSVAAASNQFLFVGYTADRRIRRGDSERLGASRVWEVALTDVNTVLGRRIMLGSDANRPRETDIARVQWLLTTNEASRIDSDLYLNTTNGVAMDAVDYRGQTFDQVLDDCAQASGKNYYVSYWGETISAADPWGYFGLWYGAPDLETYTSMLRLSNFLPDIDSESGGNTFAIAGDTELLRDPSRVFSGVYLPWDGGNTYIQRASIYNQFAQRDTTMNAWNVKSQASATNRANRYLDDIDTEEDIITTSIIVPAAKVNHLREGMRVQFKATHLPGYEDFVWLRVLNRTVEQLSEQTDTAAYRIRMELSMGESVVAEVPEGASASAVLYQPDNQHTGLYNRTNEIVFQSTGDYPGSGYPADPTTGSLSITSSGGRYTQVNVLGNGTLDFSFTCNAAEVYDGGARTASFRVLKNGTPVATGTDTTYLSGATYWLPTATATATGVSVTAGDTITCDYAGDLSLSGRWPIVPGGSGSFANRLIISGTLT